MRLAWGLLSDSLESNVAKCNHAKCTIHTIPTADEEAKCKHKHYWAQAKDQEPKIYAQNRLPHCCQLEARKRCSLCQCCNWPAVTSASRQLSSEEANNRRRLIVVLPFLGHLCRRRRRRRHLSPFLDEDSIGADSITATQWDELIMTEAVISNCHHCNWSQCNWSPIHSSTLSTFAKAYLPDFIFWPIDEYYYYFFFNANITGTIRWPQFAIVIPFLSIQIFCSIFFFFRETLVPDAFVFLLLTCLFNFKAARRFYASLVGFVFLNKLDAFSINILA